MSSRNLFLHLPIRNCFSTHHWNASRNLTTTLKICQLKKNQDSEQDCRQRQVNNKIFPESKQIKFEDRIWTIPNALCVLRILASPLVAYTVINNKLIESVAIVAIAGLTDFADGYIARRYESQRSALGGILDPIADKILISTLYLSATISGQLPVFITSVVIGRDLLLILGGSVMRYQMLTKPRTIFDIFRSRGPKMEVKSSILSKWNTTLQFNLIAFTLVAPIFNISESLFLTYFQYLVATTTIASGLDYMFNRNNYISQLKQ